jgi:hypothetical protein
VAVLEVTFERAAKEVSQYLGDEGGKRVRGVSCLFSCWQRLAK